MPQKNGGKGLSNYGKSKWLAEDMIKNGVKKPSCYIFRPRALYGVGDTKIIPRILRLVKNHKLITPGDMKIKVSMTHFSNLMAALELAIQSPKKGVFTYNVADEEEYMLIDCIKDLLDGVMENSYTTKKIPVSLLQILGQLHLAGMSPLLVRTLTKDMFLDLSKIKADLKYTPKSTFHNQLKEIQNWILSKGGVEGDFFKDLS